MNFRLTLFVWFLAGTVLLAMSSCGPVPQGPSQEHLYAARSKVEVRSELAPDSPVAAVLGLHDRVRVLRRRRSLAFVQVEGGAEGWAREQELISDEEWRHSRQLARFTEVFPSQGVRRAFDTLNVHTTPSRQAPTIYQLAAEEPVDLIRSRVVEPPADSAAGRRGRSEAWFLVRAHTGPVGWALASRLYADIPIDVAQYAEGRRIVAFFALDDAPHPTWLWTQSSRGTFDFSSYRVFRWNTERSSYQTIGVAKDLKGRLPVEVHEWVESERGSGPGFSLNLEREDGESVVRTYLLSGERVHRVSEKPTPPAIEVPDSFAVQGESRDERDSWFEHWREKLETLL